MKEFSYTVTDPAGLHARPAGLLAKKAQTYKSAITLHKGEKVGVAKSLLSIMGLAVKNGEVITVKADGEDEDVAIAELEVFFKETI